MISGAYLILPVDLPKNEYNLMLKKIGASLGILDFDVTECWSDGISNVYIRLVDSEDPAYEYSDMEKIRNILQNPARSFISLEYDEGETSLRNLMKIVKEFGNRWPIALDSCYGGIYGNDDMDRLLREGIFFSKG